MCVLIEIRMESHLRHAFLQRGKVGRVTREAPCHTAFGLVFCERLSESEQGVAWRREAELPVALESLPLCLEIKREGPSVAALLIEFGLAAQGEGKARDAFDVLVRRGDQVVDPGSLRTTKVERVRVWSIIRHFIKDEEASKSTA